MGGIRLAPDVFFRDIHPRDHDLVLLPGADIWLDAAQVPVIDKAGEIMEEGTVVAGDLRGDPRSCERGLLDHRPHTSNDLSALKRVCPGYKGDGITSANLS
jgi:hypothetical protein